MHKYYIVHRRADGLPQCNGMPYGKVFGTEDSGKPSLSETLRTLQDQGQYVVGVSFVCERPNAGCPCQL